MLLFFFIIIFFMVCVCVGVKKGIHCLNEITHYPVSSATPRSILRLYHLHFSEPLTLTV